MTTMTKTVKKSASIIEWLQDLLLPASQHASVPTMDTIRTAMAGWNAAEVGDAIGAIIMTVVLKDGKPDRAMAQRFAGNTLIQRGVALRRGSRVDAIRTREKLPMAWAALQETLEITMDAVRDRELKVAVEAPVVDEVRIEQPDGTVMTTPLTDYPTLDDCFYSECESRDREQRAAVSLEELDDFRFESVTKPDRRLARIEMEARDSAFNCDGNIDKRRSKRQRKHVHQSRAINLIKRNGVLNPKAM